jgi:translation initiation factor 2 gamma subunit (eIF-2gamma)
VVWSQFDIRVRLCVCVSGDDEKTSCAYQVVLLSCDWQCCTGGFISVGLTVDPTLTRADRLVGQVRACKECLDAYKTCV